MEGLNLSTLKEKVAAKLSGVKKENKKNSTGKNVGKQEKHAKKVKKEQKKQKKQEEKQEEIENDNDDDEAEVLRREALELGATEDDIKLLKGLNDAEYEDENDSEILEIKESGKDIDSKDLTQFMTQIGLGNTGVQEVEEEEEVEYDEKEEDEDSEEDEKVEEEVVTKEPSQKKEDPGEKDKNPKQKQEEQEAKKNKQMNLTSVDSKLLTLPVQLDWHNNEDILGQTSESKILLQPYEINQLFEKAQKLLEKENEVYYEEFSKKSSQKKFFSEILTSGTLNDKISAITLMIQESPVHNMKSLKTLLAFCSKKSRTASLQAITAFKDLLSSGLLPSDRKLKHFKNQPGLSKATDTQLMLFYYEDYLKNVYFELLQILEKMSQDSVVHVRMSSIGVIYDLLKSKPEQEQNLLTMLVNKLGDKENKVCAQVSYQILQLEQEHPAMKSIIVKYVVDFMNKNYSNYNSRYYSILTLNQTILTSRQVELANSLIKAYFVTFEQLLKDLQDDGKIEELGSVSQDKKKTGKNKHRGKLGKKGGKSVKQVEKTVDEVQNEQNSKLFSAVLSGLNRAFPFADLPDEVYLEHLEYLYKIVHSSNFSTTVQALSLINNIVSKQSLDSVRYYKSLYETLLDERLVNSAKQGLYLNLLYKSLKSDTNEERVLAFVKRILQVCVTWMNVGAVSGMFYLMMELAKVHESVWSLLKVAEEEATEEEAYDIAKRDPRFARADKSLLYELFFFVHHFHPTVNLYATSFQKHEELEKPDLGLNTLSHFLDKFVYKNPKQTTSLKGSSIMQPLGGAQTGSLLVKSTNKSESQEVPVNLKDWFNVRIDDIKPEERFFHEFFKNRTKEPKAARLDVEEPGDSDLDEEEVWKALVNSRPDLEDDISDEDVDFEDFSMSEVEDEDEDQNEDVAALEDNISLSGDSDLEAELAKMAGSDSDNDADSSEGENEDDGFEEEFTGFDEDEAEDDARLDDLSDGSEGSLPEFLDAEGELSSDEELEQAPSKKRSSSGGSGSGSKSKKQKLRDLPTFASVDDYMHLLQDEDD